MAESPSASSDGESDAIPAPLPLARRTHGCGDNVVLRNVNGDPVTDVEHRDSAATARHWVVEAAHFKHCVPTGEPRCPACQSTSSSIGISGEDKSNGKAKLSTTKMLSSCGLTPPIPGTMHGSEAIWDQDSAYELHKLMEWFENSHCECCGEGSGQEWLSTVNSACKGQAAGSRTWAGSKRFTVYAHEYGESEVNIVSVSHPDDYTATCEAVTTPDETIVPFAAVPLPIPDDSTRVSSYVQSRFAPLWDDDGTSQRTSANAVFLPTHALQTAIAARSPSVSLFHPQATALLKDTLQFGATFESGNLKRADRLFTRFCPHKQEEIVKFQKTSGLDLSVDQEYDLWLREDLHTSGNIQWFYFSVKGAPAGLRVRFNLVNHNKGDSLFNYGLLPAVYSERDAALNFSGWRRLGSNPCYYRSFTGREKRRKMKSGKEHIKMRYFYTVSFTYTFTYSEDTVYFAYCQPYTASRLQRFLRKIESEHRVQLFYRRRVLCNTLAGNPCDLITITEPTSDPDELARRQGVMISARVHPGETNSSWMMQGFLRFITSDAPEAQYLRSRIVFKIIPMLNPDGVLSGNYRCSLMGVDLNRRWDVASRFLYPTIHAAKAVLARFSSQRKLLLYCDLHGHSRRFNIFIYGCAPQGCPALDAAKARLFPHLLFKDSPAVFPSVTSFSRLLTSAKPPIPALVPSPLPKSRPLSAGIRPKSATSTNKPITPTSNGQHVSFQVRSTAVASKMMSVEVQRGRFSFSDCCFAVQESKRSTARVVAWEELGIANAFTLEASFCGSGSNDIIDQRSKEMTARRKLGYGPFLTGTTGLSRLPSANSLLPPRDVLSLSRMPSSQRIPPITASPDGYSPIPTPIQSPGLYPSVTPPIVMTSPLDEVDTEDDDAAPFDGLKINVGDGEQSDGNDDGEGNFDDDDEDDDDDEADVDVIAGIRPRIGQPKHAAQSNKQGTDPKKSANVIVDVQVGDGDADGDDVDDESQFVSTLGSTAGKGGDVDVDGTTEGVLWDRIVDYPGADVPSGTQQYHYSTLDLELQGKSIGMCLLPLLPPMPIKPVKLSDMYQQQQQQQPPSLPQSPSAIPRSTSLQSTGTARSTTPSDNRPLSRSRTRSHNSSGAVGDGDPTSRPKSAQLRGLPTSRVSSPLVVNTSDDKEGQATPESDLLAQVMKDMEVYGLGKDEDSGSDSCPSDDNEPMKDVKAKPAMSKLLMSANYRSGNAAVQRKAKKSAKKHHQKVKSAVKAAIGEGGGNGSRPTSAAKTRKKRKSGIMTHTAASKLRADVIAIDKPKSKPSLGFGSSSSRSPVVVQPQVPTSPLPLSGHKKSNGHIRLSDARTTPTSPDITPSHSRSSSQQPLRQQLLGGGSTGSAGSMRKGQGKKGYGSAVSLSVFNGYGESMSGSVPFSPVIDNTRVIDRTFSLISMPVTPSQPTVVTVPPPSRDNSPTKQRSADMLTPLSHNPSPRTTTSTSMVSLHVQPSSSSRDADKQQVPPAKLSSSRKQASGIALLSPGNYVVGELPKLTSSLADVVLSGQSVLDDGSMSPLKQPTKSLPTGSALLGNRQGSSLSRQLLSHPSRHDDEEMTMGGLALGPIGSVVLNTDRPRTMLPPVHPIPSTTNAIGSPGNHSHHSHSLSPQPKGAGRSNLSAGSDSDRSPSRRRGVLQPSSLSGSQYHRPTRSGSMVLDEPDGGIGGVYGSRVRGDSIVLGDPDGDDVVLGTFKAQVSGSKLLGRHASLDELSAPGSPSIFKRTPRLHAALRTASFQAESSTESVPVSMGASPSTRKSS